MRDTMLTIAAASASPLTRRREQRIVHLVHAPEPVHLRCVVTGSNRRGTLEEEVFEKMRDPRRAEVLIDPRRQRIESRTRRLVRRPAGAPENAFRCPA